MKPDLKNITICAADCVSPALAARAIHKSMELCEFGDAILFSDQSLDAAPVRNIRIQRMNSKDDYSLFMMKELVKFIQTPFVLIVQWDGYVLEPQSWQSCFTDYDLIGAKWPWHKDGMAVGNGGFTLRSKKLLDALSEPALPFIKDANEDEQICRIYRPRLINEYGIRFAPEDIADAFSYERILPDTPTFGFHGLFNMWRHLEDEEMIDISNKFSPGIFRSIEFFELLIQYFLLRKFRPLRHLYSCAKQHCRAEEIRAQLLNLGNDAGSVTRLIDFCEKILNLEEYHKLNQEVMRYSPD